MAIVYVLSAVCREGYMKKVKTFLDVKEAGKAKDAMLKKNKYCKAKVKSKTV